MKQCTKCKGIFELSNFRYNRGKPRSRCIPCMREDLREHYRTHKKDYIRRKEKHLTKMTDFVKNLKETTPCADCGFYFPYYVMDFDHQRDKEYLVSRLTRSGNVKRLKNEIEKCEIVCSNCHRIRTHGGK